jgi:hypothetical protein
MKLRLKSNSIRLRLNQTEVHSFLRTGELVERIQFPGSTPAFLVYGVRTSREPAAMTARFEDGTIMVTIPETDAGAWANHDERVGLYYEQEGEGGGPLRIMIEKDFQCIDGPPEEVDPAGYPNPLAAAKCKSGVER